MFGRKKAKMLEGATEWHVVGTSYRQPALAKIAGKKKKEPADHEVVAAIVPEPENEHDSNAVAVQVDGELVGYLSRGDAKKVQPLLLEMLKRDKVYAACRGRVIGGVKRSRKDETDYGVRLYFDLPG